MSIVELDKVASLQVQRDNGNLPNKKLPPVKNVSDDGMLVGITGVEPIWDRVLTPEILDLQSELFWAWCKKHDLPSDDYEIISIGELHGKVTWVLDQADQNYRDKKPWHVKRIANSVVKDGFDLGLLLPIIEHGTDPKDKTDIRRPYPLTGNHRGRALLRVLDWDKMPVIRVKSKDSIAKSRIKTITNQKDRPELSQSPEEVIEEFKCLIDDKSFPITGKVNTGRYKGKGYKQAISIEIDDFQAKEMSSNERTLIKNQVWNYIESKKKDLPVQGTGDRWDPFSSSGNDGRTTYKEVCRGEYISGIVLPEDGDAHWADDRVDVLVTEDGTKIIGKACGGGDLNDALNFAQEWYGKKLTDTVFASTGMSADEALKYKEPYRIYTGTKLNSKTKTFPEARAKVEESWKEQELIAKGYAVKLLEDNAEYYLKAKKQGTPIKEIISGIDIGIEHTGVHIAQIKTTVGGVRKEKTLLLKDGTEVNHLGNKLDE